MTASRVPPSEPDALTARRVVRNSQENQSLSLGLSFDLFRSHTPPHIIYFTVVALRRHNPAILQHNGDVILHLAIIALSGRNALNRLLVV